MRSLDTTAVAHGIQRAVFRAMTGEQRVLAAMEMADEAREISLAGIRSRQPELDDEGVRLEWLRLLHGEEVVKLIKVQEAHNLGAQ